jgi:hypothetical protein
VILPDFLGFSGNFERFTGVLRAFFGGKLFNNLKEFRLAELPGSFNSRAENFNGNF